MYCDLLLFTDKKNMVLPVVMGVVVVGGLVEFPLV
jgi:hypothetical protein